MSCSPHVRWPRLDSSSRQKTLQETIPLPACIATQLYPVGKSMTTLCWCSLAHPVLSAETEAELNMHDGRLVKSVHSSSLSMRPPNYPVNRALLKHVCIKTRHLRRKVKYHPTKITRVNESRKRNRNLSQRRTPRLLKLKRLLVRLS